MWRPRRHPLLQQTFCRPAFLLALATFLISPILSAQTAGPAATLDQVKAPTLVRVVGTLRPGAPLHLSLALEHGRVKLDLDPISYRAPGFKLELVENGQSRWVDPGPPRTVEGAVRGLPGSRVLGVVKPSGLELTLRLPSGKVLELRPVVGGKASTGRNLFSLSPAPHLAPAAAELDHSEMSFDPFTEQDFNKSTGNDCANLGTCVAKIIFDTDYLFYFHNGSNTTQAMATIDLILAQVNERYAVLKIRHELAEAMLRMDESSDPYDDPEIGNPQTLRDTIREQWITTESSYDIDFVHLLTSRSFPGSGGQSPINGVCGSGKYTFASVTGSDCSSAVKVAHELGHTWGAYHTGGIMGNGSASCTATWDAASTTSISATRDLVDGICLDLAPVKNARFVSQTLATSMNGGQQYPVSVTLENTGVVAWSPVGPSCNAFRLAQVGSSAWTPVRAELPAAVLPGHRVTVSFNVTAPPAGGVHNFQLQMVEECVAFFGDLSSTVAVNVTPAPVKNAQISNVVVPTSMVAGQTYAASITVQNTGNVAWSPIGPQCNAYRLGSVGSTGWNPIRVELPAALPAGNTVPLNFNITAPSTAGTYTFQWQMVHECVEWFGGQSPAVSVVVTP